MNINLQILKKKTSVKKKNSEIDADFYWKIVLYTTFVFLVISAVFGFYTFSQVNKEVDTSLDPGARKIGTVKKDRLDKALEYFTQREAASKNILNSTSPVVDPSR